MIMANKVVHIKKYRYKAITTYVGADGKKHRITRATKLYTRGKGLNKAAIEALAKKTDIDAVDLLETVKFNKIDNRPSSVQTVLSTLANSRVERFLGNFGIDINDLTSELQMICPEVDVEWITNDAHWVAKGVYKIDGPLTLPDGQKVDFVWSYNEGALWQVRGE